MARWRRTTEEQDNAHFCARKTYTHISICMVVHGGMIFFDPVKEKFPFSNHTRFHPCIRIQTHKGNPIYFFWSVLFFRGPSCLSIIPLIPGASLCLTHSHHGSFSLPHSSVFYRFLESQSHQFHRIILITASKSLPLLRKQFVCEKAIDAEYIQKYSGTHPQMPKYQAQHMTVYSHTWEQLISKVWIRL